MLYRLILLLLVLACITGCDDDGPPDIHYSKGDLWVANFRNGNFPARTFTGDKIYCSSIEISNGHQNFFFCLDLQSGKVDWAAPVANWASTPPIVTDSFIYFSTYVGDIYKFDKAGNKLWQQKAEGSFDGHVLNPLNNNLIIHTIQSGAFELSFEDGHIINRFAKDALGSSEPVFYQQYILQAGIRTDSASISGKLLRCMDYPTGKTVWERETLRSVAKLFVRHDRLYFVDGNRLYCTDAGTGTEIWRSDTLHPGDAQSPTLVFEGRNIFYEDTNLYTVLMIDSTTGKITGRDSYQEMRGKGLMAPHDFYYTVRPGNDTVYTVRVTDSLETPSPEYNIYIKKSRP